MAFIFCIKFVVATLFSKPGVFNYGNKFIAAATEVLKV